MTYKVSTKKCECGNDIWEEKSGNTLQCANCNFTREYTPRKPDATTINKSQQQAIDQIRNFFSSWGRFNYLDREEPKPIHEFKYELLDWGPISLVVRTTDNPYTEEGGHFFIGPRGKIEVVTVYQLGGDKEFTARHYAKMLRGHVKKW